MMCSQDDSFFYIDPTLLSLLLKTTHSSTANPTNASFVSSKLSDFRHMCITFLQDMVKWEEEEQGPGVVEHVSIRRDALIVIDMYLSCLTS
jgi:hypothetical protein